MSRVTFPRGPGGSALIALLLVALLGTTGCRTTYYSIMETFGREKRDLLKSSLDSAGEQQKEANEQFQDALTQLKELTGFDGGDLEKQYRRFNAEYEACETKAAAVGSRIRKVEQIARDLFREWEDELNQIQSPSLRASSRSQLERTRNRYEQLHASLTAAESGMAPVLARMKDYALYLKHNLNAAAIGSLQGEALTIEREIAELIESMNRSIAETEAFVREIENE